jgi:bacteriocin-like protein
MRKKALKRKPKPADTLLRTSKKDIELSENELDKVSGGRRVPGIIKYQNVTLKSGVT